MSERFLPYGRQHIDDDDVAAVSDVLRRDYLTTGPAVSRFEQEFAAATGSHYAVACSSGTAGLHLAAMALEIGPDDCAIVPTMTFLATANCVRYVGGDVVFADCDPNTGLMRAEDLERALERVQKPLKAILPVHLNGQPCDMPAIQKIASEYGAAVVEDACHALGGSCNDEHEQPRSIGECANSDIAVFSMHPVKLIAAGEGGVVNTKDARLYERLARLRTHGMERNRERLRLRSLAVDSDGTTNPWYYEMAELGYNYRISDINSALALSQLCKIDRFIKRRNELAEIYDRLLAPLAPLVRPVPAVSYGTSGRHLYVVLIDFAAAKTTRGQVMRKLRELNIGSQVHYLPVHLQPYYRKIYGALDLPNSVQYYERILSIPFFFDMMADDVERVVAALRTVLRMN